MAGLRLFVSDLQSFEILKSPPDDPFLSPRVALRDLLPFRADAQPGHRKVTRGVVSFVYPGRFFFIQEGNTGIRVDSVNAEARPGTEMEVAGFVTQKHPFAGLGGAVIRATGRESSIEVRTVTSKELMNPPLLVSWTGIAREDWNGRRIRMSGRLLKAMAEKELADQWTVLSLPAVAPDAAQAQAARAAWLPGSTKKRIGTSKRAASSAVLPCGCGLTSTMTAPRAANARYCAATSLI
jgi:hypothetical protein